MRPIRHRLGSRHVSQAIHPRCRREDCGRCRAGRADIGKVGMGGNGVDHLPDIQRLPGSSIDGELGRTAPCTNRRVHDAIALRTRVNRFGLSVGCLAARRSVGAPGRVTWRARARPRERVRASVSTRRGARLGNIQLPSTGGTVQGVSHRHCCIVHWGDRHGHDLGTSRNNENAPMRGTRGPAFLPP